MRHQTKASRTVGEGWHENGHVAAVTLEHNALSRRMVLIEVGPHRLNELTAGVGLGSQPIGNEPGRLVTDAQLLFIDVGVVDPVDHLLAEGVVVSEGRTLVVAKAQRLKEVLINDVGTS